MKFLETIDYDWIDLLNFYERPFRAKIIPARIWEDLDHYKNDQEGLVNYCKKWKTRIKWIHQFSKAKIYKSYVAVGGEYAPDDNHIYLHIYTDSFEHHSFSQKSWDAFKFRLIQTLMHEVIHCMQFSRRQNNWSNYVVPYKKVGNAKKDAERRYLSEFDEIQAYAHCVYLDFKTKRPNTPVKTLLDRCKNKRDSSTLHYFLKTFNYDFRNNVSPQKIVQQIGKWDRKYNKAK
jgi:hypothetical protein